MSARRLVYINYVPTVCIIIISCRCTDGISFAGLLTNANGIRMFGIRMFGIGMGIGMCIRMHTLNLNAHSHSHSLNIRICIQMPFILRIVTVTASKVPTVRYTAVLGPYA